MTSSESVDAYRAVRLEYNVLERLEVRQLLPPDSRIADMRLDIVLQRRDRSELIVLEFSGVRNLRFAQSETSVHEMVLEITSIAERQWENLNYAVTDQDDGVSFLCDRVTFRRQ